MSKTDLENNLKLLKDTKESLQKNFNDIAVIMINELASKFPNSFFGESKNSIFIYMKARPAEAITLFIKNVYSNDIFRTNIKTGNEDFFMSQTYENTVDDKYTTKIFEFKDLWKLSDKETREFIKNTMLALINRCEVYINVLSDINSTTKQIKSL